MGRPWNCAALGVGSCYAGRVALGAADPGAVPGVRARPGWPARSSAVALDTTDTHSPFDYATTRVFSMTRALVPPAIVARGRQRLSGSRVLPSWLPGFAAGSGAGVAKLVNAETPQISGLRPCRFESGHQHPPRPLTTDLRRAYTLLLVGSPRCCMCRTEGRACPGLLLFCNRLIDQPGGGGAHPGVPSA